MVDTFIGNGNKVTKIFSFSIGVLQCVGLSTLIYIENGVVTLVTCYRTFVLIERHGFSKIGIFGLFSEVCPEDDRSELGSIV